SDAAADGAATALGGAVVSRIAVDGATAALERATATFHRAAATFQRATAAFHRCTTVRRTATPDQRTAALAARSPTGAPDRVHADGVFTAVSWRRAASPCAENLRATRWLRAGCPPTQPAGRTDADAGCADAGCADARCADARRADAGRADASRQPSHPGVRQPVHESAPNPGLGRSRRHVPAHALCTGRFHRVAPRGRAHGVRPHGCRRPVA